MACSPPREQDPPQPHQADALGVVWVGAYGEAVADLPAIAWPAADCHIELDGGSWAPGVTAPNGPCVQGYYHDPLDQVVILWLGSFSGSAFAHELMHAHLKRLHADSDPQHARSEWAELPAVNGRLSDAGL